MDSFDASQIHLSLLIANVHSRIRSPLGHTWPNLKRHYLITSRVVVVLVSRRWTLVGIALLQPLTASSVLCCHLERILLDGGVNISIFFSFGFALGIRFGLTLSDSVLRRKQLYCFQLVSPSEAICRHSGRPDPNQVCFKGLWVAKEKFYVNEVAGILWWRRRPISGVVDKRLRGLEIGSNFVRRRTISADWATGIALIA